MTGTGATRPNVLLILTDQLRGDCLGIEGHPVLETPHLDFIGSSGAHFRRAYSESPICAPARRTIMTGQSPATHGLLTNHGAPFEPAHTLAGELRWAGYQTEMVGKLHLSPGRRRFGFDHLVLAELAAREGQRLRRLARSARGRSAVGAWGMAHGATPNGFIGRPFHLDETLTHAFWCASEAIAFLAKRDRSAPSS